MIKARRGKIGVYGKKTRRLQRCLSFEAFGLSMKDALVYLYQGSADSMTPSIDDIGCTTFFEVPERVYAQTPIAIPVGMELMMETATDFSRFGLINPMGDENTFRVHIDDFNTLGRELIVGDIFEVPFHSKDGKRALWEITDVDLRSEMEKFIAIIKASPLKKSRRSDDLSGVINRDNEDFLVDLAGQQDTIWSEQVPTTELQYDVTKPTEPVPVDYRNDNQTDFLDDPTKSF